MMDRSAAAVLYDVHLLVQTVRKKLYDELTKINNDRDWSFILKQIGELAKLYRTWSQNQILQD